MPRRTSLPSVGNATGRPMRNGFEPVLMHQVRLFSFCVSRPRGPACAQVLLFDPTVGITQSRIQTGIRLPFQNLLNKRVVAITASHATGRIEIVFAAEFTPVILSPMLTRASIVTSSVKPRLMGVAINSSQCMISSMPSTQSAMYIKLRVWVLVHQPAGDKASRASYFASA
jgi:hypothetical protein